MKSKIEEEVKGKRRKGTEKAGSAYFFSVSFPFCSEIVILLGKLKMKTAMHNQDWEYIFQGCLNGSIRTKNSQSTNTLKHFRLNANVRR